MSRRPDFRRRQRARRALLLALLLMQAACRHAAPHEFGQRDVQGVWWSGCDEPAAEFAIDGERYYGDFEGEFVARVEHGVLTIDPGEGATTTYTIVEASPERLVLIPQATPELRWALRTCPGR